MRGLSARCTAGRGSDVLAVVFSQVRVPAGAFGLSRLFGRTAHACLFLNQPDNAWYRGAADAVDAAVERAVAVARPSRIVFYGSSMGAFGAIEAAARRPEADVIAFAPDFSIGEASSRSAMAGLPVVEGEPALPALLDRPGPGRAHVLAGLFDPYDAGVAVRLAEALPAGPSLVTVAGAHEIHDQLYSVNVVRRIISTFTRDPAEAVADRELLLPLEDPGRYRAFAALAAAFERGEAVPPATVAALRLAGNPGWRRLLSDAEALAGDLAAAEATLAAAQVEIDGSPLLATLPKRYRKTFFRRRIALVEALGRPEAAAALSAEAARRFPTDAGFSDEAGDAA